MEPQPRDIAILETVGELGTADLPIIHAKHFPHDNSGRACQRRVKMLADVGLLKRTRILVTDQGFKQGSLPALLFLTPHGADLVESETGIRPRRVLQSDPKPFTLRHRLLAVQVRLAFDQAAALRGLPTVEWIMEQDTKPGITRTDDRSPSEYLLLWDVFRDGKRTVTFRPDSTCHLQIRRPSGDSHKSLLAYFEVDRSTEGHKQWQQKLKGIAAFFRQADAWKRHWPDVTNPTVVLFVVCLTHKRIHGLADVVCGTPAARFFRFAKHPIEPGELLTSPVWSDADGKTYSIIKPQ